jgi:hypothetical protein
MKDTAHAGVQEPGFRRARKKPPRYLRGRAQPPTEAQRTRHNVQCQLPADSESGQRVIVARAASIARMRNWPRNSKVLCAQAVMRRIVSTGKADHGRQLRSGRAVGEAGELRILDGASAYRCHDLLFLGSVNREDYRPLCRLQLSLAKMPPSAFPGGGLSSTTGCSGRRRAPPLNRSVGRTIRRSQEPR